MIAEQMAVAWERCAQIVEQMDMDAVRNESGAALSEEEIDYIYDVCEVMKEQANQLRSEEVFVQVHSNLVNPNKP